MKPVPAAADPRVQRFWIGLAWIVAIPVVLYVALVAAYLVAGLIAAIWPS